MKPKFLILCFCLLVAVSLFGCGTKEGYTGDYTQDISAQGDSSEALPETEAKPSFQKETEAFSEASGEGETAVLSETQPLTEGESAGFTEKAPAQTEDSETAPETTEPWETEYNEPQINFSDLE